MLELHRDKFICYLVVLADRETIIRVLATGGILGMLRWIKHTPGTRCSPTRSQLSARYINRDA